MASKFIPKSATTEIREMWLINIKRPYLQATIRDVVVVNAKYSVYCQYFNRRCIYGTSSFGTKEAADRERRVRMVEFIRDWWNINNRRDDVLLCHKQLILEFNYKHDLRGKALK